MYLEPLANNPILLRLGVPVLIGFTVAILWKFRRTVDERDGSHLVVFPAIIGAVAMSVILERCGAVIVSEPAWLLASLSGALAVEGLRRT